MGGSSIVVDVETTGLPIRDQCTRGQHPDYRNVDLYDSARMVSIAWQVLGPAPKLEPRRARHLTVKPVGFVIPKEAVDFHGITTEMARDKGQFVQVVLAALMEDLRDCEVIVAHNARFDLGVIRSELYRLGREEDIRLIDSKQPFCTIDVTRSISDCPAKLKDCLMFLTGREHLKEHDAEADVAACAAIYGAILEMPGAAAAQGGPVAAAGTNLVAQASAAAAADVAVAAAAAAINGTVAAAVGSVPSAGAAAAAAAGAGVAADLAAAAAAAAGPSAAHAAAEAAVAAGPSATVGAAGIAGAASAARIAPVAATAGRAEQSGFRSTAGGDQAGPSAGAAQPVQRWQLPPPRTPPQPQPQPQPRPQPPQQQLGQSWQARKVAEREEELAALLAGWGAPTGTSIVFDTETSGLPDCNGLPFGKFPDFRQLDLYSTGRLLSIAWRVLGPAPDYQPRSETKHLLVKPFNFEIDAVALKKHGITKQRAMADGVLVEEALDQFVRDLQGCDAIVAHNTGFDLGVVRSELYRLGREEDVELVSSKRVFCTMRSAFAVYRLDNPPRLELIYKRLTGRELVNAHQADADVDACAVVYVALQKELAGLTARGGAATAVAAATAGMAALAAGAAAAGGMAAAAAVAPAVAAAAAPVAPVAAGAAATAPVAAAAAAVVAAGPVPAAAGMPAAVARMATAAAAVADGAARAEAAATVAVASVQKDMEAPQPPPAQQRQQQAAPPRGQQPPQPQAEDVAARALLALWARLAGNSVVVHVETDPAQGCRDGAAGPSSADRIVRMSWRVLGPAPALKRTSLVPPTSFLVLPDTPSSPTKRRRGPEAGGRAASERKAEAALPLPQVLEAFIDDLEECEVLVAHDAEFHLGAIRRELTRLGLHDALGDLSRKRTLCTMRAGHVALGLPAQHSPAELLPLLPSAEKQGGEERAAEGADGEAESAQGGAEVEGVARCYAALLDSMAAAASGAASSDEMEVEVEYESEGSEGETSAEMEELID